jgi:hypothetical protein
MTRVLVSNVGCRSWREASSTLHRGLPRGRQRRGDGSATRRHVRTGRATRDGRKGAEGSSAWTFTGKHESTHSVARSRVEPAEGAPVSFVAASLTGGKQQGGLAAWMVAIPDERRVRRANAGTEPTRERPRSDRERQRWRRRVRPPQSKGAGGLQPTTAARVRNAMVGPRTARSSRCAR